MCSRYPPTALTSTIEAIFSVIPAKSQGNAIEKWFHARHISSGSTSSPFGTSPRRSGIFENNFAPDPLVLILRKRMPVTLIQHGGNGMESRVSRISYLAVNAHALLRAQFFRLHADIHEVVVGTARPADEFECALPPQGLRAGVPSHVH